MQTVAIIGAGPAGIACAVQLARYGYKPLLFEKDIPGGLLKNANLVENYPGFPKGIPGNSLIKKLSRHLILNNIPVISETVSSVSFKNNSFFIKTNKNNHSAQCLVIASGTTPVNHGLTLTETWNPEPGTRVFYEVHPIRHVRNSNIAIIGAGDAAFDYAMQLSSYNKVYIFNRSEKIKCLPLLWHRAKGLEQISYLENHSLISTETDTASSCLKLFFQTKDGIASFNADYIIFAIGRKPELSFADPGLISLFEQLQQEGKLYLAGDVKNDIFRQASIAAGDGIRAAMQIYFNESNQKDLR